MQTNRPIFFLAASFSMLVLTSGCATNGDLAKVQNQARDAQRTADMALSTAQSALSTAQHAQSTSDQANDRALRSEEMLNRGFKYSMRK